jgi:hypothetical protein
MRMIIAAVAWLGCSIGGLQVQAAEAGIIKIHDGKHWTWYSREDQSRAQRQDIERLYEYADQAYELLGDMWGTRPPEPKFALLVWPKTGGGFASPDISEAHVATGKQSPGIGVSYDAFSKTENGIKAYWAYALITHEMVNAFLGRSVGVDWPVDWWADHRSPFPFMTAIQIKYELKPDVALHHRATQIDDPLVQMFMSLKDQYGWYMFRQAFKAVLDDGIQWGKIGENPSALRTNYVAAYLQIGAPDDILRMLEGKVPNLSVATAREIMRAREEWHAMPLTSPARAKLKDAFLHGDYRGH